eukprot:gene8008-12320_t
MRAYCQALGCDGFGTGGVMLFFEESRYLFNVPEGTQRYCTECKVKLMKVRGIFLTSAQPDDLLGLPGLLLTLREQDRTKTDGKSITEMIKDREMGCAEPAVERSPVAVVGPAGLRGLMDSMASFLKLPGFYEASSPTGNGATTVAADPARLCRIDALPDPETARVTYRVDVVGQPGRFLPEKAKALGVNGRKRARLIAGETVESDVFPGRMVRPADVLGPRVATHRVVILAHQAWSPAVSKFCFAGRVPSAGPNDEPPVVIRAVYHLQHAAGAYATGSPAVDLKERVIQSFRNPPEPCLPSPDTVHFVPSGGGGGGGTVFHSSALQHDKLTVISPHLFAAERRGGPWAADCDGGGAGGMRCGESCEGRAAGGETALREMQVCNIVGGQATADGIVGAERPPLRLEDGRRDWPVELKRLALGGTSGLETCFEEKCAVGKVHQAQPAVSDGLRHSPRAGEREAEQTAPAPQQESEPASQHVVSASQQIVAASRRIVSASEKLASASQQATSTVSASQRAMFASQQAMSAAQQAVSASQQAMSASLQAMSPSHQAVSASQQATSASQQATSASQQAVSASQQAMSALQQAMSASHQAMSASLQAAPAPEIAGREPAGAPAAKQQRHAEPLPGPNGGPSAPAEAGSLPDGKEGATTPAGAMQQATSASLQAVPAAKQQRHAEAPGHEPLPGAPAGSLPDGKGATTPAGAVLSLQAVPAAKQQRHAEAPGHEPLPGALAGGSLPDEKEDATPPARAGGDPPPLLTLLGTGGMMPSKYRNVTSILLETRVARFLLLDCGEGTLGQIRRLFDPLRVLAGLQAIWISHMHADHHIGLPTLLLHRRRRNPHLPKLLVFGPGELEGYLSTYDALPGVDLHYEFVALREECRAIGDGISVANVVVEHCEDAWGCVVTAEKEREAPRRCRPGGAAAAAPPASAWKIAYSGDTRPSARLREAAFGCDMLVHEATFDDDKHLDAVSKKHSTVGEALALAAAMSAKQTVLTHFSQRYPKAPPKAPSQLAVALAFDLMTLSLASTADLREVNARIEILAAHYESVDNAKKAANIKAIGEMREKTKVSAAGRAGRAKTEI